jgi:hypothetical protein
MTRAIWRALAFIVVAVAGTSVSAAAAAAAVPVTEAGTSKVGSIGIHLLDVTASLRDDPRAADYIIDHLPPGAIIERRIEVVNKTAETRLITLFPGGATIRKETFEIADLKAPSELTGWIRLTPATVTLPPGGTAIATASITVPRDVAPGERYGVIYAETAGISGDGKLRLVNRVGIRVYLDAGPGNPPATDFSITSLSASRLPDGRPAITAAVRNSGGRAIDLAANLRLSHGPGGSNAGPFRTGTLATLAPGQSGPVTMVLAPGLPNGPWTATLILHSGLIDRTTTMRISFPAPGQTRKGTPLGLRHFSAIVTGASIAVGALVVVTWIWTLRRRRRLPRRGDHS